MGDITLRKANVVKRVGSEDKALALEAKGFIRTDGKVTKKSETSDARMGELEKELTETKEKLEEASKYAEEADKKIAALEAELSGTKEQLEAAVKKNKAAEKNKKELP